MAERKTNSQGSSRAKGATGKSTRASTGRSSGTRSKKAAETQRLREEAMQRSLQKRRVASVILFAAGVLFTLMALIPGSMGWRALYDVMHGLFGVVPWAFGPLMISAALVISSQKTHSTIQSTIIKRALFMLILCAAVEIFGVGKINGANFGEVFLNLYVDGVHFAGGGVFALFLGIPLLFLGKLGAAIVIIIFAIVCILLNIPIPLNEMFSGIGGSLKNARSSVSERRERVRERRAITDEHYREIEQQQLRAKAEAREAKRLEREERKRRNFYVNDSKSDQMNDLREAVNSVGDGSVLEKTAVKSAPTTENTADELPEPLKMQPRKIRMPEVSDAKPLVEQQKSDARDYKEALKRYMEKKHPIMRENPENNLEDSDADIVPLIDALEKLNSEKSPARVSRIVDAPKSDITNSDVKAPEKPIYEERFSDASDNDAFDDVDIADIDDAELPFDLEDIIAENSPRQLEEASAESFEKTPAPEKSAASPINEVQIKSGENPRYNLSDVYTLPPMTLLDEIKKPVKQDDIETELRSTADKLVEVLKSFGVQTTYLGASRGPSVTRYELQPAPGVKLSKIEGLAPDVALNLAASGVRIAPVPDKPAVGVEVPNKVRDTVFFRELVDTPDFKKTFDKKAVTVLGKDIGGNSITCDITKMPHLLIAGTTGSGKSVCVNSLIMSILMKATPDDVRLIMVDPKQVEFMMYNGIPHLLIPVVTDPKKAAGALAWVASEMENRYTLFRENFVRKIEEYNELAKDDPELSPMPYIVVFIDELADLMMTSSKDVEDSIVRIAQKARAAGVHLVIATQKPTVQVVTGLIKSNVPSRIALSVSSNSDSRVILDAGGAEKLLGNGDMLYVPMGEQKPIRLQGCYVSNREIESVVHFIGQTFKAEYDESIIAEIERQAEMVSSGGREAPSGDDPDDGGKTDDQLEAVIEYVIEAGQASISSLQRRFHFGFAKAGRIIDTMEKMGIVGGYQGSKPRQVLMTRQEWNERKLRQ